MNQPAHSAAVTARRVRRLMCLFTGLLVASTWPLWIPGAEFPDIPWAAWLCSVREGWWDWIPLAAAALWLLVEFRGLPSRRLGTWALRAILLIPIAFALLVDQHRLQPWVWQMLLMAIVLGLPDEPTAIRCLRWLTVSIYFHSALSKVDMAFLDSHGQWLLEGLASSLGLSTALWSESLRRALAAMFPVGELVIAMTLLYPRTRRLGLCLAIAMHVSLLLTLGPLGHAQKPAVLLWNAFFIALDILLFGRISESSTSDGQDPVADSSGSSPLRDRAAVGLTIGFVSLPFLSWGGYWDHWPSWAVYSSRPAIVQMEIPQDVLDDLPASLKSFVGLPQPLSDRCLVNLDGWSFETLWCPVYPQERYRLAVAAAVGATFDLDRMRVVIHSPPDRWTGQRKQSVVEGDAAVLRAHNFGHYWWNTRSRDRVPTISRESEN